LGFLGVPGAKVDDVWDNSWRHCFVVPALLAARPSHVGVHVDGLACPLHCPMSCSLQTRGLNFLSGAVLSRHVAIGGGAFSGDAKLLSLDIWWSVDRLGTCVTEFYME
jgi:hypothetical protein